jgi:pimeloyl-ACP methyl ester carboxylesterase
MSDPPHEPSPPLFNRTREPEMIGKADARIDYDEVGSGPTVVLVPGSCSTGAAWRPIISHWTNRFHCVTTSLLGYGATAERRTAATANILQEIEVVESVIRRAGHPVHLVGHSFGGLVALAVALGRPDLLRSLTILEAPAPEILRRCGEDDHYQSFRQMSRAYVEAFQAGQSDAIAEMIDFYGGTGTFAAWPQRVRDYAIATTPANLMDWSCAYGFDLTPALLARVAVPSLVAYGEASHPAPKRANELLGRCIPGGRTAAIPGAAHFMIATHAGEVARLVAAHIDRTISTSAIHEACPP